MKTEEQIKEQIAAHQRRLNQLSRQIIDCLKNQIPLASLNEGYDDTIIRIKELEWVLE